MAKAKKPQRAILIDPKKREILVIEYSGDFKEIYTLLDIELFEIQNIPDRKEDIYCDEEGLLKPIECGFQWGNNQPLAGKGLILGFNPNSGNSISSKIELEEAVKNIKLYSTGTDFKNAAYEWSKQFEQ